MSFGSSAGVKNSSLVIDDQTDNSPSSNQHFVSITGISSTLTQQSVNNETQSERRNSTSSLTNTYAEYFEEIFDSKALQVVVTPFIVLAVYEFTCLVVENVDLNDFNLKSSGTGVIYSMTDKVQNAVDFENRLNAYTAGITDAMSLAMPSKFYDFEFSTTGMPEFQFMM